MYLVRCARSSWRTHYYLLSSSSWRTAQWQRARRAASAASVTAVCAAAVYAVLVLGVLSLITRAFLVSAAERSPSPARWRRRRPRAHASSAAGRASRVRRRRRAQRLPSTTPFDSFDTPWGGRRSDDTSYSAESLLECIQARITMSNLR